MAISKRLRYEILRRDNHTCRYCGAKGEDSPLTIDHVTPVSLGGTDDPANLVAACKDCNAGKAASNPDQPLVEDVAQDAIRWVRAMREAALVAAEDLGAVYDYRKVISDSWTEYQAGRYYFTELPVGWEDSADQFMTRGLPMFEWPEIIRKTWGRDTVHYKDKWRYCCGVAWKKVAKLQEIAKEILAAEDSGEGSF